MVDWNKEINFGRKKEPAEEPEAVEETQSPGSFPHPEPGFDPRCRPSPSSPSPSLKSSPPESEP